MIKMTLRFLLVLAAITVAAPFGLAAELDRTVLPIPEPVYPTVTELDVGIDLATPVVEAIGSEARLRFTGRIPKVTVEVR